MSDFDALKEMSANNMDIAVAPPDNFKRANTGKDGYGEVVMAVSNEWITKMATNEYLCILYIVSRQQFNVIKEQGKP